MIRSLGVSWSFRTGAKKLSCRKECVIKESGRYQKKSNDLVFRVELLRQAPITFTLWQSVVI